MNTPSSNARMAGALFLIAYVTYGVPQITHTEPLLTADDPLASIGANSAQLLTGALIMSITAAVVVGIGLFLYPVLAQRNQTIALTYVATRIFEALALLVGIVGVVSLVPLSQEYAQASATDANSMNAVATLVIEGNLVAYQIGMIGLSLGSLPFCYLLYRSKLVPRGITVFGLIGYPALLVLMVLELFSGEVAPSLYALYVPGAIFELGLGVWLVVKGFNSSALAPAEPTETAGDTAG